jgi:hypothetical protein
MVEAKWFRAREKQLAVMATGSRGERMSFMGFRVVMTYSDGEREELDEDFETEDDAAEFGREQVSNFSAGGEVLHLSNPGDYPEPADDVEADFEVIETAR